MKTLKNIFRVIIGAGIITSVIADISRTINKNRNLDENHNIQTLIQST
jgi:hypothetical protein